MRAERALRLLLTLIMPLSVVPPGPAAQPVQPARYGYPPGSYQTVRGARLWVESEGKGTPLLLIAGGPGMAHDYFHPYFSTLASTHQVIYFDALGRGRSDRARKTAEYTLSRDVEELEALRKALGLTNMDIVGHSYGTLVAQAYALKYPQAVRRLVLISPLHSGAMWQASNDLINGQIEKTMPEVWKKLQGLRLQGLRSSASAHRQAYRTPPGLYFYQPAPSGLPLDYNPDVYYGIAGNDADFVIGGGAREARLPSAAEEPHGAAAGARRPARLHRVSRPRPRIQDEGSARTGRDVREERPLSLYRRDRGGDGQNSQVRHRVASLSPQHLLHR